MAEIYEYFQRAYRRGRTRPFGRAGEECRDVDGNSARFWLTIGNDFRILSVEYRCTTCTTLVALCEYLAEALPGQRVPDAGAWSAGTLLEVFRGIPQVRHGRAALAVQALQSAVIKAQNGGCV